MKPTRQSWTRLAWMGVMLGVGALLAFEAAWRVGYAVQMANPAWLWFPDDSVGFGQRQGAQVAAGSSSDLPVVLPPEGLYRFAVEDQVVTELTIHPPGFRGPPLHTPTPGRLRVAAVGGSSTFSPECGEGQSWPEQLQSAWNRRSDTPVVFNAGAVGATSAEVRWIAENLVLPNNIDVLLITTAFNDVPAGHVMVDLRPLMAPWHRRLLWGRSLFYTAVSYSWMSHQRSGGGAWQAQQDSYARNLEAMADAAVDAGAQPVFIAQPILGPDQIELHRSALARRGSGTTARRVVEQLEDRVDKQRQLVARMQAVAADRQVPVVDVRAALLDTPRRPELFELFLHLTPEGAERFAALLAPELAPVLDRAAP